MIRRMGMGLLLLLLPVMALAGTTGKISGIVKDKDTGQPLPAASIALVGTSIGAIGNQNGQYTIINVPPGIYTVRCSYLGYQAQDVINVRITPDYTTSINFELSATTLTAQPVEVLAERPFVQKDVTQSVKFMTTEEILNRPIRGYQEAVATQAGVVSVGQTNYIRGGEPMRSPIW
ncbi:MAG: carboxypeptidase-like regulatory domain-containing protein [candidate division Zixibacteria bacterium]|nr:carboxypeptidase-like regulatory domain-containing protein [candidate division Zixibacteria bacterium]